MRKQEVRDRLLEMKSEMEHLENLWERSKPGSHQYEDLRKEMYLLGKKIVKLERELSNGNFQEELDFN